MPTQKDVYNPTGLTPQEMSQRATELSDTARSKNISQVPEGAIKAETLGAGIGYKKDILYQSKLINDESFDVPFLDSSLTSAPAKTYLGDISNQQTRLQADIQASETKLTDLDRMLREQQGGLIERQIKAAEIAQKPIKEQIAIRGEQTETARKEAEASQRVAAFRMQQAATPYAEAATAKRERAYALEDRQFAIKSSEALNQAWDQALAGEIAISQRLLGEASTAMQERQRLRDEERAEREQTQKLQEYEDNRAIKAQDRAMTTIGNLVSAGFTIDQVPQSYLQELDIQSGMLKGFSAQTFEVAKSAQESQAIQDIETRKTREIENAGKVIKILNDLPVGESISVDGVSYTGYSIGDLKAGTQLNENTGEAFAYSYNPRTQTVNTTSLGNIGTAKNGFETRRLADGSLWRVNPQTDESQPFYASDAQTTWDAAFPEGTVGPILPDGDPSNVGQCAAAVNYWYGKRLLDDKFDEKQAALKEFEIKKESVKVGSTFLMTSGTTGHVGIVNAVEYGHDGKTILKFTESNYIPPGGGKVSHSRTMDINDPRIKMFADIAIPNLPLAGSDSALTRASYGGEEPVILGARPEERGDVEVLAKAAEINPAILEGLTPTVLTKVKAEMARRGIGIVVSPEKKQKMQDVVSIAQGLLQDKNLGAAVGPISKRFPTLRGGTANFEAGVTRLKSLLTLDNLGIMKGVLSDTDIKILSSAATALDFGMSEQGFRKELQRIIDKIKIGTAETIEKIITISSPDGSSQLEYDLSDPAQKAEYEEALKAGYK